MLERAGLIECYQEQGRRKYFRIIRKTVLEVAVSPHSYGVRAYRFEEIPKEDDNAMAPDMNLLRDELNVLEEKRRELRDLLDKIESREMEVKHLASGLARNNSHDLLESEILVALLSGESTASDLAVKLEVPEIMVLDRLKRLKERESVQLKDQEWSI
jgi:ArsR family transcriptional regulator